MGLLAALSLATPAATGPLPEPQGRPVIEPFGGTGVTLGGSLRRQFDEVCEYYLRIPNDDLLKPYRVRAGKPAPGADLGGCYIGHNPFGQFLAGYARMSAASGDKVYATKATALMHGWAECIEPDGFFFAERNPQLIPYYYEKMVGGLLDVYAYGGDRKALDYLAQITAWAVKNVSRVRLYATPTGNDGGEWYTLSENLYRAYLLSGDPMYRDFAAVWEYTDYWGFFTENRGADIFTKPGWYHAYSHVNSLNGLAAAYRVNGNPTYLETLKNAYDYLQANQCWATGGYGPNESLMPREGLVKALSESANHFETQCGSWAGCKITKSLLSLTGDARYGDWTERLLLNGIGASIPMAGDGRVFYYSGYNLGGAAKRNLNAAWPCCSGTRPQAIADYHDLIYFRDADSLYVNLFTESSVVWDRHDGQVVVAQHTRFPESNTIELRVSLPRSSRFGIRLRVPGWLAGPLQARVNGKAAALTLDARHWAGIERKWKDGDCLTLELPMNLWVSRLDPARDYPAAILYGPVALAVRSLGTNPAAQIDLAQVQTVLTPSPAEPLTWTLAADPSVLVRPFYAFKEEEKYFLYLDPTKAAAWAPYKAATYSGNWVDFNGWMTSSTPGSAAEYSFEGAGIRVHYFRYDDAGRLEVSLDGKVLGILDEYGSKRGEPAFVDYPGLTYGRHKLGFRLLPDKTEASKGCFVNLAAFETLVPGG
jgi:DUF1680 family protein